MWKYFLGQLLQVSAWIGIALIICAFVAPRWFIILMGVLLIFTNDAWLTDWVKRNAPGVAKWLDKTVKEIEDEL